MEAPGVLDLPGLSFPAESTRMPRRVSESSLRDLIVPGVGGRRVFRILLMEACRHACESCPMAPQRELGSLAEPKRLARAFVAAWRRGWCDGVFVTAGVPKSATWAMEKLLETVETLRFTLGFRGYVHVKVPAGANPGQLERMMALVDRVSFQLEPACVRAESPEGIPEIPSQRFAARGPARRRDLRTRRAHPIGSRTLGGIGRVRCEIPRERPASGGVLQPMLFDQRFPSATRP